MTASEWWREGVIYQVYPRSFQDSNGDGLGDLPGVIAHLDYLTDLGVAAIWLSPFYPSPDVDFGYDISDHCEVDPRYGSLADFMELLEQAHRRGIRVILDLVLNHTSDQHPWFQESRQSRTSPKRDWYIWVDPTPDGRPPNNWLSILGGSAWEFDPTSGQYYLHLYHKCQPDINWRNPLVRQAQLDVVRTWLSRGVDGFRLDIFNTYFKDKQLRNNPKWIIPIPYLGMQHIHDCNQPELVPVLKDLRSLLDEYPASFSVGETFFPKTAEPIGYCGEDKLHTIFNFEFVYPGMPFLPRLVPGVIRKLIQERERNFNMAGVWPTTVMGNHDVPRPASRYCTGEQDGMAKIAMALLLTLRGTPFIYNGDEIGMRDVKLRRSEIKDPIGKPYWPVYKGRDGCRSPMQWDGSAQAGFSTSQPWLIINPDYSSRNVAAQAKDPDSVYNLTRELIALRKACPALRAGVLAFIECGNRHVLAYRRFLADEDLFVVLNFSTKPEKIDLGLSTKKYRVLFSSCRNPLEEISGDFTLRANEVLIARIGIS